jgi:SRSO17 transposase
MSAVNAWRRVKRAARLAGITFRSYCTGLLLPGKRKSVEPMAARIMPTNLRQTHQSMHHFVADSPWNDERLLARVVNLG